MNDFISQNPQVAVMLALGFILLSSLAGGMFKVLFGIIALRRLCFFIIPFGTGAAGMLYLLN